MSTELLETSSVSLLRFYAGKERGLSYQITMKESFGDLVIGDYIQLTDAEMGQIISAYVLSKANGKV